MCTHACRRHVSPSSLKMPPAKAWRTQKLKLWFEIWRALAYQGLCFVSIPLCTLLVTHRVGMVTKMQTLMIVGILCCICSKRYVCTGCDVLLVELLVYDALGSTVHVMRMLLASLNSRKVQLHSWSVSGRSDDCHSHGCVSADWQRQLLTPLPQAAKARTEKGCSRSSSAGCCASRTRLT
jgi:hypothetical protein